jgi:hypothetical protein
VTGERDRPWTEQESLLFAASTARAHERIQQFPSQDRLAPLQELGAIAELARPLVHPAADAAVHRALGSLWSSAPAKLPAVRASAARSRSTTVTRGPADPQRRHSTPPRTGGEPSTDQQRRHRSR